MLCGHSPELSAASWWQWRISSPSSRTVIAHLCSLQKDREENFTSANFLSWLQIQFSVYNTDDTNDDTKVTNINKWWWWWCRHQPKNKQGHYPSSSTTSLVPVMAKGNLLATACADSGHYNISNSTGLFSNICKVAKVAHRNQSDSETCLSVPANYWSSTRNHPAPFLV